MLAVLLRSNPDAFIGGNINVIKSGAVLDIPGTEAASVLPGEARSPPLHLARSPDGLLLAAGGADGALVLYDLEAAPAVRRVSARAGPTTALAWSPDGRHLATADNDGLHRLWDAASLALVAQSTPAPYGNTVSLDFGPPAGSPVVPAALLSANSAAGIALLNPGDLDAIFSFRPGNARLVTAAFAPDGRRVALLDVFGFLRIVPLENGEDRDQPYERLLRHYKYQPSQGDLVRDEGALRPPAWGPAPAR